MQRLAASAIDEELLARVVEQVHIRSVNDVFSATATTRYRCWLHDNQDKVIKFIPTALADESVLPTNLANTAAMMKHEADLVNLLSPYLAFIAGMCFAWLSISENSAYQVAHNTGPEYVVMSTETTKWLPIPSGDDDTMQKPDIVLTHAAFIQANAQKTTERRKQLPQSILQRQLESRMFVGRPIKGLHSALVLCDFKCSQGDRPRGELMDHLKLQWLSTTKQERARLRRYSGVLLFSKGFEIFSAYQGHLERVIADIPYDAPGSAAILRQCLQRSDPIIPLFMRSLNHFEVEIDAFRPAFRGQGASGVVFGACTTSNEKVAMKLVLGAEGRNLLERQQHLARAAGADVAVQTLKLYSCELGSAALLSPLGSPLVASAGVPYAKGVTSLQPKRLLQALLPLHLKGIAHGDARYPNLVAIGTDKVSDFLLVYLPRARFLLLQPDRPTVALDRSHQQHILWVSRI